MIVIIREISTDNFWELLKSKIEEYSKLWDWKMVNTKLN